MTYLEQELRSYSFIAKIQEIAPYNYDGQWIWNLQKPTDSWITPTFYKSLGFSEGEVSLRTRTFWQQMFAKSDVEQMLETLQNQQQQMLYENLIQLTGKQGDVFWVKCIGIIIRDELQQPIRFVAYLERQAKVHHLEDYLSLQKQANHIAKIGVWEVNLLSKEIYWSQVTKEIYEVPKNYTRHFEKVLNFFQEPKYKELLENKLAGLRKGEEFDIRVKLTTYLKHEKWVRIIGIPVILDGQYVKAYGLVQDINTITNNYHKLKEQETLFRSMFEYAASAIVQSSLDGVILRANFSFKQLIGMEEVALLKINTFSHPEDVNKTKDVVAGMIKGDYFHKTFEKRYINKNGQVIWAIVSISLVIDNLGVPKYFLSQIVDVTAKKNIEFKLSSITKVAQDQNQRLLNFAQIVSHQLRSHTSDMQMLMKLIKMEETQGLHDPYFKMLFQAVGNLSSTVKDLNEVILIYNQEERHTEELILAVAVEKVIARCLEENAVHSKQISVCVAPNVAIGFKQEYLENVIYQLVDNAIKYRSPLRALLINIHLELSDEYVILHISDNGLGINLKHNKDKMFKMYQTFHTHEKARGIGLFLVKNQLEAYQHYIEVESQPNQGSKFSIYFKKQVYLC